MENQCVYISKDELLKIGIECILPPKLKDNCAFGISTISNLYCILEDLKVNNALDSSLFKVIVNVENTEENIYISTLDEDNLQEFLSSDENYQYFNKAMNPHDLVKTITLLKMSDNQFWDESILIQAL